VAEGSRERGYGSLSGTLESCLCSFSLTYNKLVLGWVPIPGRLSDVNLGPLVGVDLNL